jgi:hypothetical protein
MQQKDLNYMASVSLAYALPVHHHYFMKIWKISIIKLRITVYCLISLYSKYINIFRQNIKSVTINMQFFTCSATLFFIMTVTMYFK